MSTHLTPGQVSEALLGMLSEGASRHLGGCAECRGEVERVRGEMALFGSAVREWTGSMPLVRLPAPSPRRLFVGKLVLAGSLAAAAVAALYVSAVGIPQKAPRSGVPITDGALLSEVNDELSRSVPASLEPLAKLDDRGSSSSAGGSAARR